VIFKNNITEKTPLIRGDYEGFKIYIIFENQIIIRKKKRGDSV